MDGPSLDGCWRKLERAYVHAQALRTEIARIPESVLEAIRIETAFDPQRYADGFPPFVSTVAEAPTVPPILSLIVGDAIHNLRCALDHLAYQLVWLEQGAPWDETQFPIVTALGDLNSWRFRETLARMHPDHATVIKQRQPYGTANDYRAVGITGSLSEIWPRRSRNLLLGDLNTLSNTDKHRLLLERLISPGMSHITAGSFDVPTEGIKSWRPIRDCANIRLSFFASVLLKPGAEVALFEADVTGPNPKMDVDFDFRPEIGVGTGGDVRQMLDLILGEVVEVVREFEQAF